MSIGFDLQFLARPFVFYIFSLSAKRIMNPNNEHRFDACLYDNIWTRLTADVSTK